MSLQTMIKKIEDTQLCREIVRVNSDWYYVPASEGQICYKVMVSEDGREYCTCEEYTRNMKSDPILKCKHVMAVINAIKTGEFKDINYLPAIKPLLDERFITNIQGKDFVVYAGLLDLAHQMGLKKLEVNPVQYPMKDNGYEAICTAIAQTKDGVFSDIGDTNPSNCHKMVSKHILRMASTRAKARVLRDMTNVGMTCLEELEDLNEVIGNEIQKKATPRRTARKPKEDKSPPKEQTASEGKGTEEKPKDLPKEPTPKSTPKQDNAQNISEAQRRALLNLARRRNISQEELDRMVNETFHSSFDNLTQKEASQFIRQLQSAA